MVRALRPPTRDLPAEYGAGKRDCIRSDSCGRSLNLRRWCHLAKKLSQNKGDPEMNFLSSSMFWIATASWLMLPLAVLIVMGRPLERHFTAKAAEINGFLFEDRFK